MEKIIEVYGKQIENEKGNKFISATLKIENKDGNEYVNVRFTQDCNIKLVKGYQKVKFDTVNSNVKNVKDKEGNNRKILYIKEAEIVPYTEEEKQKMNERQEQAVLDLLG